MLSAILDSGTFSVVNTHFNILTKLKIISSIIMGEYAHISYSSTRIQQKVEENKMKFF